MLESWTDGATKSSLVDFVAHAVDSVAPQQRVAVFDNDGTLWCEKPAYIQLDFLVRRIAEQVAADPPLGAKLPYAADAEREFAYTAGAENALGHAEKFGWTRASMRNDWRTVFGD